MFWPSFSFLESFQMHFDGKKCLLTNWILLRLSFWRTILQVTDTAIKRSWRLWRQGETTQAQRAMFGAQSPGQPLMDIVTVCQTQNINHPHGVKEMKREVIVLQLCHAHQPSNLFKLLLKEELMGKIKLLKNHCLPLYVLPRMHTYYFQCDFPGFFMMCFKSRTHQEEGSLWQTFRELKPVITKGNQDDVSAQLSISALLPAHSLLSETSQRLAGAELDLGRSPPRSPIHIWELLTQILWSRC